MSAILMMSFESCTTGNDVCYFDMIEFFLEKRDKILLTGLINFVTIYPHEISNHFDSFHQTNVEDSSKVNRVM